MTSEDALAFLQEFHEQRKTGDLATVLTYFEENPEFCLAGECRPGSIAMRSTSETWAEIGAQLVGNWEWIDVVFHSVIANGEEVFARYTLTTRFIPEDRTVTTEIVDHMRIRNRKFASMTQFIDTAYLSAVANGEA